MRAHLVALLATTQVYGEEQLPSQRLSSAIILGESWEWL